jgi:hypothetical protein
MVMYGLPHGVVTENTGCPATRSNAGTSVLDPSHPDTSIRLRIRSGIESGGGGDHDDEDEVEEESPRRVDGSVAATPAVPVRAPVDAAAADAWARPANRSRRTAPNRCSGRTTAPPATPPPARRG